jgi:AmmeMemoRadiSam system protein B
MNLIREPAVAGTFYPGRADVLERDIKRYLDGAHFEPIEGNVVGVVSPHAGYIYSGPVAAYGFKTLLGRSYDTVVVIAPSHRVYFEGVAVMDEGGYRTPLGMVGIDEDFSRQLLKTEKVAMRNPEAHREEHSLEVQIPFLQVVLEGFKIVPLIMGVQTAETCEALAQSLHEVMKERGGRYLVVGSTDLSHYYSSQRALQLDGVVVGHLERFDLTGLMRDLEAKRYEACGAGPMIATLNVSQKLGATESKVLKYANSGDVSGDRGAVVGYVSCVLYGNDEEKGK